MGSKKTTVEVLFTGSDKGLTSTLKRSNTAFKAFQKSVKGTSGPVGKLRGEITGLVGAFVGFSAVKEFSTALFQAGVQSENLTKSFTSITGSGAAAAKELDYVRQVSDDLGLVFQTTANDFKNISAAAKGTSLEGAGTKDIFLGIAEASTALGMSADDTTGSLRAISQMISKGNVQAEELRGQLGERLPGAFQLAAESMGVTTQELNKMLELGQVAATDLLPKLANVLHEKYGQAALDASNSAQAGLNRFKTAWFDLKVVIANAGFMDKATGKIKELTAAMKDPAVQQAIIELSQRFFAFAESLFDFIKNWGVMIAKIGAGVVILKTLLGTVASLVSLWSGLNAAMLVMTGVKLVPWLAQLGAAFTGAAAGASALSVFFRAFLVLAAADATLKIAKLVGILWDWHKATKELAVAQAEMKSQQDWIDPQIASRLNEINTALGTNYRSMDALFEAEKRGEVAFDDLTATWVSGSKQMAQATVASSAVQKNTTIQVTDAMKTAWQGYADKVKAVQDDITGRQRSLTEELRAMSRTGMSDDNAWRDQKREAKEYEQAAKLAVQAGNFEEAIANADKAKEAYKSLNHEVKDGDNVLVSGRDALKTSMQGVESAGRLAIEILKQQKEHAEKAADALNFESDFQLGDAFTEAGAEAKKLAEQSGEVGKKWRTMFVGMEKDASTQIKKIDAALDKMARDRKVSVTVTEVQARATGGMIHKLATGGKLSGYGGGDRIPALLEAGEYIIRKEAVAKFGAGLFHKLNSLNLPKFATGGSVGGGGGDTISVDLSGLPGLAPVTVQASGNSAQVLKDWARRNRLRSA